MLRCLSLRTVSGSVCSGSTTTSAPQRCARARRPGEKSEATTVFTPCALSMRIDAEADRPAADHDRDLALADLAAVDRVEGDGHRLGHRRDVGVEPVRDRQRQRLLDEQLLRVAAWRVDGEAGGVDTGAVLGAQQREGDDGRALGNAAAGLRAALGDRPAELVAHDDGLVRAAEAVVAGLGRHVGPVVDAVAGVQVGAADPAPQHLQAQLPRAGVGRREVGDGQLGMLADDGADHGFRPPDDVTDSHAGPARAPAPRTAP